jgi:hypothetical protein
MHMRVSTIADWDWNTTGVFTIITGTEESAFTICIGGQLAHVVVTMGVTHTFD